MSALERAWRLLQAAETLRTIERHGDRVLPIFSSLDGSVRHGYSLTLRPWQLEVVHRAIEDIQEAGEQAAALIAQVPVEAVQITYDHLAAAAAQELAHGTVLDPDRLLLAARLLHYTTGWRALAHGLRTSETQMPWGTTTLKHVLGSFRGVTPQLIRRVTTAADLAPGTRIAECEPGQIVRLADRVEEHVGSR
jgi:hypothetical protein